MIVDLCADSPQYQGSHVGYMRESNLDWLLIYLTYFSRTIHSELIFIGLNVFVLSKNNNEVFP